MKEIIVTKSDSGSRFDKYLKKLLPGASSGLIYKQLRKKNITLNGNKSDGRETIGEGDVIRVFFSDETYEKFHNNTDSGCNSNIVEYSTAYNTLSGIEILFENEHIAAISKPLGVLSQKSSPDDISLNEWWLGYLIDRYNYTDDDFKVYKPSIVNRLDRNTTGIVLAAKTLVGSIELSELIRKRLIKKFYRTLISGNPAHTSKIVEAYLRKDSSANTVYIKDNIDKEKNADEYSKIITAYNVIKTFKSIDNHIVSLAEVELITGKTHQIRAHLAHIGHPIVGDTKYGDQKINTSFRKAGIKNQLLHSYRVEFPSVCDRIPELNNLVLICKEPEIYGNLEK